MSIFGKIKDAVFGKKAEAAEPAAPAAASPVGSALDAATQAMATAAAAPVDVEAILTAEAAKTDQDLNWRTSIVGGQLARRYGVPYRSSNTCAANAVDAQAAYESMFSISGAAARCTAAVGRRSDRR